CRPYAHASILEDEGEGLIAVMPWTVGVLGAALLAVVLWDAFETIVLPRRISRPFRLTKYFYRSTWSPWRAVAGLLPSKQREPFLSYYGPLSPLLLLGFWAVGIVVSFGLLQWAAGSAFNVVGGKPGLGSDLYMSGTTFFTLGLGDVVPRTAWAKFLTVAEAGTGFAFLALVIGYFPIIYQAFSRREAAISMLDARAGTPPTAGELIARHSADPEGLGRLLYEWERWAADVLESHLSYPLLAYFRSQHTNQSWLAALTCILDTSALVAAGLEGWPTRQAELTFAMARHTVVDLSQVFSTAPITPHRDRLTLAHFERLRVRLETAGLRLRDGIDGAERLAEWRRLYEPHVAALSEYLRLPLPPWVRELERRDNWEASPWDQGSGAKRPTLASAGDTHF
ncbi:MAG: potassium channel family protein, partial [Candidatus Eiseniibacteriota bacterium]